MEKVTDEKKQKGTPKKSEEKVFDLNTAFSNYLKLRGIDPAKTVEQKNGYETLAELRHSFFGGCAQMYVVLALEVPQFEVEHQQKAVEYIANLLNAYAAENEALVKGRPEVVKEKEAAKDVPQGNGPGPEAAPKRTFPGSSPVKK